MTCDEADMLVAEAAGASCKTVLARDLLEIALLRQVADAIGLPVAGMTCDIADELVGVGGSFAGCLSNRDRKMLELSLLNTV
jgi:hypothetical protein